MRRCIGSPCSTYLVLRSRDVSPGHLLRLMPASGFCVPVPVTSGRTGAAKFENLKSHFFQSDFTCALSCALPAF
ncbi:unnamed protein product [Staurois parvus]|uniref:Uncharacterized protein n=1 Tax=Staurois parvus TaxID=386267 RepID=A0ABN9GGL0_9NEOB|nr:unnamed protein product [Staurois parvus]